MANDTIRWDSSNSSNKKVGINIPENDASVGDANLNVNGTVSVSSNLTVDGQINGIKVKKFSISGGASKTFSAPSSYGRFMATVFTQGADEGERGIYSLAEAGTAYSMRVTPLFNASSISYSVTDQTVTFTNNYSSAACYLTFLINQGFIDQV